MSEVPAVPCIHCELGVPLATETVLRHGNRQSFHLVSGVTVPCAKTLDRAARSFLIAQYRAHTEGTAR